jgi:hypothetical protein
VQRTSRNVSRSQLERINLIMELRSNLGLRKIKRVVGGPKQGMNGSILVLKAKVYSCSSRARGLLNDISFFIN